MVFYIWLLFHSMVIMCTAAGCNAVSMSSFNYVIGLGTLELVFEVAGVIRIFKKNVPPVDKGEMKITKRSTRKIK